MKFVTAICSCTLVSVLVSPWFLSAQQKQEYMPKATSNKLVETALHGVPGKRVTIVNFTFAPKWIGGKHYHTGPVFVYVVKGSLTIEEEGKAQKTFTPGQVYVEPIGHKMRARNLSANESTEIVVFQVHGDTEPLMYKAK